MDQYSISFVGLKKGIHRFDYEIDTKFFESFSESTFGNSQIRVHLTFDKKEDFFELIFDISGVVECECDRCLEPFDMELSGSYKVIVKLESDDRSNNNDNVDIIFISSTLTHLNVRQLLYEYINLSVPMKRIHPSNEKGDFSCNNEVSKILEGQKREAGQMVDPRWNELKKLR